jgi:hypothetical protein
MPRYYFDVWAGDRAARDEVGLCLQNLSAAEEEAIRTAAEMGHDRLPRGRVSEITVQVRDDHGQQVLIVAVSMTVRRREPAPV